MYFDPSEAATCCACSQMWVNLLMLCFGCYTVLLIGAWSYWFKNNAQAQVVNEWQNAVLTSVVWFHVAQYLTFVALTIFLRFQRSTLAIVPSKGRWSAVNTTNRFEVGDLEPTETQSTNEANGRSRRKKHKSRPHSRSSRTPAYTEESEADKRERVEAAELDKQVEAMVAAAGLPEEAVEPAQVAAEDALKAEVIVELEPQKPEQL